MSTYICSRQMKRILYTTAILAIIVGGVLGFLAYSVIYKENVRSNPNGFHELYISTNWTYDSLKGGLQPLLINTQTFEKLADRMNLRNKVIPGYYKIPYPMNNRNLIRKLRSGSFEEVKVLLRGSSNRPEIIRELSTKLQPDSTDLYKLIKDEKYLSGLGYTKENWPCMMMANTYHFNWAIDAKGVFNRFVGEKKAFWNRDRTTLQASSGLTQNQVIILASIVDAETMRTSELERIAGVYLNRLQKNWPLQADPTIRFFVKSEGRQRVLNNDLKVDHPYNTYIRTGLPPGPILLPSVKAVDAVLNAESHDFMFFCAKDDLSGYHLFTSSLSVHNANASRYHRALNLRNIMR
mgnify:CR=1 FL=1